MTLNLNDVPDVDDEATAAIFGIGVKHLQGEDHTDELVKGYLPIVRVLANKYAIDSWTKDDFMQAGCLGLLVALRRAPENDIQPENLTGYVYNYIRGHILKALKMGLLIRQSSPIIKIRPLLRTELLPARMDYSGEKLEVEEQLNAICSSETDRKIIQMRVAGFKLREIGVELQVSRSGIGKILRKIGQAVLKYETQYA